MGAASAGGKQVEGGEKLTEDKQERAAKERGREGQGRGAGRRVAVAGGEKMERRRVGGVSEENREGGGRSFAIIPHHY